jgi:hypothetical protein
MEISTLIMILKAFAKKSLKKIEIMASIEFVFLMYFIIFGSRRFDG